jgi:adenosine deaminase
MGTVDNETGKNYSMNYGMNPYATLQLMIFEDHHDIFSIQTNDPILNWCFASYPYWHATSLYEFTKKEWDNFWENCENMIRSQ